MRMRSVLVLILARLTFTVCCMLPLEVILTMIDPPPHITWHEIVRMEEGPREDLMSDHNAIQHPAPKLVLIAPAVQAMIKQPRCDIALTQDPQDTGPTLDPTQSASVDVAQRHVHIDDEGRLRDDGMAHGVESSYARSMIIVHVACDSLLIYFQSIRQWRSVRLIAQ